MVTCNDPEMPKTKKDHQRFEYWQLESDNIEYYLQERDQRDKMSIFIQDNKAGGYKDMSSIFADQWQ